jgi:hypothetical protein
MPAVGPEALEVHCQMRQIKNTVAVKVSMEIRNASRSIIVPSR